MPQATRVNQRNSDPDSLWSSLRASRLSRPAVTLSTRREPPVPVTLYNKGLLADVPHRGPSTSLPMLQVRRKPVCMRHIWPGIIRFSDHRLGLQASQGAGAAGRIKEGQRDRVVTGVSHSLPSVGSPSRVMTRASYSFSPWPSSQSPNGQRVYH